MNVVNALASSVPQVQEVVAGLVQNVSGATATATATATTAPRPPASAQGQCLTKHSITPLASKWCQNGVKHRDVRCVLHRSTLRIQHKKASRDSIFTSILFMIVVLGGSTATSKAEEASRAETGAQAKVPAYTPVAPGESVYPTTATAPAQTQGSEPPPYADVTSTGGQRAEPGPSPYPTVAPPTAPGARPSNQTLQAADTASPLTSLTDAMSGMIAGFREGTATPADPANAGESQQQQQQSGTARSPAVDMAAIGSMLGAATTMAAQFAQSIPTGQTSTPRDGGASTHANANANANTDTNTNTNTVSKLQRVASRKHAPLVISRQHAPLQRVASRKHAPLVISRQHVPLQRVTSRQHAPLQSVTTR